MTRAHYTKPITDNQGNLLSGINVRVLEPGTTDPISGTIWSDATSANTHGNPTQYPSGVIDFYLDAPRRVRLGVTYQALAEVFFDDVDVLEPVAPQTDSSAVKFTLNSPVSLSALDTGDFAYTPVTAFRRGLVYRFSVTSTASTWSIRVTSQPDGSGEIMFEATGVTISPYAISWPWVYENQEGSQAPVMYVGVSNLSGGPATFTLDDLRAEVFVS